MSAAPLLAAGEPIANPLIDYSEFRKTAIAVESVRESHRITEQQFMDMSKDPATVVLDARSADKYALRHISGAVSLPFTDFTADTLAKVIPTKTTRILIYCNNNFRGAPVAFAAKAVPASLNISTYIALTTYGYSNVFELGPLLDVRKTALPFEGKEVAAAPVAAQAR